MRTGCWPFFSFSSKGGKVTTKELAEELEVSSRTACGDLNALSALGIPVVADRGKNGGWRLLDEYRKTLLTLTAEEIASLFLPFLKPF